MIWLMQIIEPLGTEGGPRNLQRTSLNPDNIERIVPAPFGSTIVFTSGQYIDVQDKPEQIVVMIEQSPK